MTLMKGLIALAIASIILSSVFMVTIKTTNTATWSASEVTLWGVVGLMAVVGFLYAVGSVFGIV